MSSILMQLPYYIYSTRYQIINVEFLLFIKLQFTTKAQNILHLVQCTNGHVISWTVVPFQRSRGCCEWFDRHQKYVGEVFLHFQVELNALWVQSVPTDKNIKDCGRANVRAVPRRPAFAYIY